jgi:hypothetical protein
MGKTNPNLSLLPPSSPTRFVGDEGEKSLRQQRCSQGKETRIEKIKGGNESSLTWQVGRTIGKRNLSACHIYF